MATSQSTIDFILDVLSPLKSVRARKMFGEYALYKDEKVVALVCDDQLFVKITAPGKEFVGDRYQEGFAYPGAKPSMLIDADYLEDGDWARELINMTAAALPPVKVKNVARRKTTSKASLRAPRSKPSIRRPASKKKL